VQLCPFALAPLHRHADTGSRHRVPHRPAGPTLLEHLRGLTHELNALTKEITGLVSPPAPSLLAVPGCGPLTAAKILGETGGHRQVQVQGRLRQT
jgi:transposase